jgi:hypothetical protein
METETLTGYGPDAARLSSLMIQRKVPRWVQSKRTTYCMDWYLVRKAIEIAIAAAAVVVVAHPSFIFEPHAALQGGILSRVL